MHQKDLQTYMCRVVPNLDSTVACWGHSGTQVVPNYQTGLI